MIRLDNLKLRPGENGNELKRKIARTLGISPEAVAGYTMLRQSIDARKKSDVHWVCSVAVDLAPGAVPKGSFSSYQSPDIQLFDPALLPQTASTHPPVVVGLGPAGLFSALVLACLENL